MNDLVLPMAHMPAKLKDRGGCFNGSANTDNEQVICMASNTDIVLAYKQDTPSVVGPYVKLYREEFAVDYSDPSLGNARITEWARKLCPEVVRHFGRAPLFDYYPGPKSEFPNILTSEAAITSTCFLKLISLAAKRVDATWFVHAGTHLGAVVHGGPIPWDDDMDVMVDATKRDEFMAELLSMDGYRTLTKATGVFAAR